MMMTQVAVWEIWQGGRETSGIVSACQDQQHWWSILEWRYQVLNASWGGGEIINGVSWMPSWQMVLFYLQKHLHHHCPIDHCFWWFLGHKVSWPWLPVAPKWAQNAARPSVCWLIVSIWHRALYWFDQCHGFLTALMCFDSVIDEQMPFGAP